MYTYHLHKRFYKIVFIVLFTSSQIIHGQLKKSSSINDLTTRWIISEVITTSDSIISITGNPLLYNSTDFKSVSFNGISDGIFIDSLPLKDLHQFTVEAVFYPEKDGPFEQRFFHCGTIRGNRIMFETRTTASEWYFDAFIKCKDKGLALANPELLHPLNRWYHVAFVIDEGELTSYVNGEKELQDTLDFYPILDGMTSIGVRQNKVSWFKGKIYSITITPRALTSEEFSIPEFINLTEK